MENANTKKTNNSENNSVARELEAIVSGSSETQSPVPVVPGAKKPVEQEKPTAAAKPSRAKKKPATRPSSPSLGSPHDKIEKIRVAEQAKLEALKEREREKTRLAIEKEREKLERELQEEIRQLESELISTRSPAAEEPILENEPAAKPKRKTAPRKKKTPVEAKPETAVAMKPDSTTEKKTSDIILEKKPVKKRKSVEKPAPDSTATLPADLPERGKEEILAAIASDEKIPKKKEDIVPAIKEEEKSPVVIDENSEIVAETPVTNLQKLREQIMAQKRLEKDLMEKEAIKIQEQDKTISEKIAELGMLNVEDGDRMISAEQLEEQRRLIESLKVDRVEFENKINYIHKMLDRLLNLQMDGVDIIDHKSDNFSSQFMERQQAKDRRIKEIEDKINRLEQVSVKNAQKLGEAEQAYEALLESYGLQENKLSDLSRQLGEIEKQKSSPRPPESPVVSDYRDNRQSADIAPLYRELDGMQKELNRLMSALEYNQKLDRLKSKEMEIDNLRFELERRMVYGHMGPYPYYPHNLTGPTMYQPNFQSPAYPREDKEPVEQPSAAAKVEDTVAGAGEKGELAAEIDTIKTEIARLKDQQMQSHNDSVVILKEVQDELVRNREERNTREASEDRDIESYKERLAENEKEKAALITEKEMHVKKIQHLEREIAAREQTLKDMQEQLNRLNEDDIIDPEFKRKIRVVRDMEKDTIKRLDEEEKFYKGRLNDISSKIQERNKSIENLQAKIKAANDEYQSNPDKSSYVRDIFERTKGKHLIELHLQNESLSDLEAEYERAKEKHQEFERTRKNELSHVKAKEAEILEYFLDRLRKEIRQGAGFGPYRDALQERDELRQQLDHLKTKEVGDSVLSDLSDDIIGEELDMDRKEKILRLMDRLEEEIQNETLNYNQLIQKLTELKGELDKRIEYEKQLRSREEHVEDFYKHKFSLSECMRQIQELNEQSDAKNARIIEINEDSMQRTEYLRLKAEINDLEVHKNDIEVKIDFYKKQIKELENKPIIEKYMILINQINKIRDAQKELREKAEAVKRSTIEKTKQYELLKERYNTL